MYELTFDVQDLLRRVFTVHILLSRYILLARRWTWMIILGIVICGGITYIFGIFTPPIYQASATLIINFKSAPSMRDNVVASQAATTTYAHLITNSSVLEYVTFTLSQACNSDA